MSVVRVGSPPFPAKEVGSCMVAKLEHVWHSVRRWAKLNGYKYIPSYGVEGIAPTLGYSAATWFRLLEVPYVGPIDLYQLDDRNATWIAEWTPLLESFIQYCDLCGRYTFYEAGSCTRCTNKREVEVFVQTERKDEPRSNKLESPGPSRPAKARRRPIRECSQGRLPF